MGKASPIDNAQEIILFLSISFLLEGSGDSIYFYPLKIKSSHRRGYIFTFHIITKKYRALTSKINEQQTKKHWRRVKSI